MKKIILTIILSVFLLTGCEDKTSTEWYINNHKDMINKYTNCLLNDSWHEISCQNAKVAIYKEMDKPGVKEGYVSARKKIMERISNKGN